MCTRPFTKTFPPSVHERYLGITSPRVLNIPCGKCFECLKKRQNDLSVRVYNEARSKGSATFVTLTYKPQCLPLAQSHWIANKVTGEFSIVDPPTLVTKNLDAIRSDCAAFHRLNKGDVYCIDVPLTELSKYDEENEHFVRITPTLYYEDVKLCMKRFRKKLDKEFTYNAVGEYGMSEVGGHRPHYHLVFFGLKQSEVELFTDCWEYGYTKVKQVNFVNRDGSDGLFKVSRYIGKYCTKGHMDIYTSCA